MNRMEFRFSCFCPFRLLFFLTFALVLLSNQNVYSADVTLVWNKNIEEELDGYRIYYKTCSSCDWTSGTGATEGDSPIDIPLEILGDPEHPEYTIHDLNDDTTYFFVATAFDIHDNESDYSNQVSYFPQENLRLEIGEVSVDQNWKWVEFGGSFQDPIVVAKSLSYNGSDPAVVRIRNVGATGFEIRVQEWDYLDGNHAEETIGYIVMERGTHTLPDGTMVEAERFETDKTSSFGETAFSRTFQEVPVVITAVSTYNEADTVTTRVRNISTNGFELQMREQEVNSQTHDTETISYIAWEPSSGTMGGLTFEVKKTGDVITDGLHTFIYNETFMDIPVFVADMQTTDGWDTSNLRWQNKNFYAVDLKVAEEQSGDSETSHTTEVVGYMLFSRAAVRLEEVIIDNSDAGTSSTGTWRVSSGTNPYGDSSLYSKKTGETYTFEAAVDGPYEVSMWWTERPSRCTGVPVEIYDGYTLLDTIEVNHQANAGQWNVLGTYVFSATARVVIISESTTCSTCADAVRFVLSAW